jgi:AraC-like DNA-binding protein
MSETTRDEARFSRPSFLPGVELVSVAYHERAFPEHSHSEWVVGAVMTGSEVLVVGDMTHAVSTGQVLRLHPDQPHANRTTGSETLRYRVAYIPDHVIAPYLADRGTMQRFASPVLIGQRSHAAVADAHAMLSRNDSGRMEQDSALAALASVMFSDGCRRTPEGEPTSSEAVAAARRYIDVHFAGGFGLSTLSAAAGISVFHLARSFRKAVGITPLAYRNQRRIVEARRLLLAGPPIAAVALDVGYADQSHLTRQFQRVVGVSPARYVRS